MTDIKNLASYKFADRLYNPIEIFNIILKFY